MRALVCYDPIGLDGLRLDAVPTPEPGPGEVRIRVAAAGLNFADTLIVRGKYQERPEPPFVPGFEVAGTVDALGPGVAGPTPGQRVIAALDRGGFAEFALARAADVVPLTDTIDDVAAAGFPIAYGTSHGALRWRADLQPGETVVVHGAAGGVGLTAVQCAKALAARVLATCRGADKGAVARAHGADHVLDTDRDDLRAAIKDLTGGRGAEVVYDPVGAPVFEASLRGLAPGGRWLVIGFAGGPPPAIPANILLVKNLSVHGFYWGAYRSSDPARVRQGLAECLRWQVEGRLRPHVGQVLPFERWREGLELLLARASTGKVVLTLADP
jgi:NADPH2:quinone reductase